MPEQRKQNDDRQRYAEQPQQNSASHTHGFLLWKQKSRLAPWKVSQTLSKNVEPFVWFPMSERHRVCPCAHDITSAVEAETIGVVAGTIGPFV
jgi:hypothetical protein